MGQNKDVVLIKFEGLEKKEVLESLGFVVGPGGYLLLGGKNVTTFDKSRLARIDDVKAIVPGSLAVITNLVEAEDYFDN